MSQRWEYLLVPLEQAGGLKKSSDGLVPDRLNELGAQGGGLSACP